VGDLEYEAPVVVSDHMPVEDLIESRKKEFLRKKAATASREWMQYKVLSDGPYGLVCFGDPHLDDPGCDWVTLERDLKLLRETPALFGIGGGDYTNAWAGRLQRLYADQAVTRSQSWQLAEWFFGQTKDTGQSAWWMLIKGNHDLWNGTADPLDWMARGAAPLEDWRARFKAVSPNGVEIAMDVAHNHKGSSIWNPLHGPMREAQLSSQARVYISNDKHTWGAFETEHDQIQGYIYWACRARGYKHFDAYSKVLGFGDKAYGATITTIVDPSKEGPQQVRCFPDLEEAVDFLQFKRRKFHG
jgi:hypothetical protein